LQEKINTAYLSKYTSAGNRQYAIDIARPQHLEATMEFIFKNG